LFDDLGTHKPLVAGSNPPAATYFLKVLSRENGGDSLMLQRLLGHTTLMMTNWYCQAQGTERPMLVRSVEFEDSLKLYTSIMDELRTYQDKF